MNINLINPQIYLTEEYAVVNNDERCYELAIPPIDQSKVNYRFANANSLELFNNDAISFTLQQRELLTLNSKAMTQIQ